MHAAWALLAGLSCASAVNSKCSVTAIVWISATKEGGGGGMCARGAVVELV